MGFNRFGRRKDLAHGPIDEALTAHGIVVLDTSQLGNGFPDMLCYYKAEDWWQPLEIKSGRDASKPNTKRLQATMQARVPIPIVRTPAEALAVFGLVA